LVGGYGTRKAFVKRKLCSSTTVGCAFLLGDTIGSKKRTKAKKQRVNLRTAHMREISQNLAELGLLKVQMGEPLNVRRRESVRRTLAEAGKAAGWSDVAALSDDPVEVAAKDVKKMLQSGVRALTKQVEDEVAEKKAEAKELEKLVRSVHKLAKAKSTEYPAEIVYSRTVKSPGEGLITKTETLTVADSDEALKAAENVERSLPRWVSLRDDMLEDLKRKRENLDRLSAALSDLVDSWRGLLKEVLVTMT